MNLINEKVKIVKGLPYDAALSVCGNAACLCYNANLSDDMHEIENYIRKRIHAKHESILEHCFVTMLLISDIGCLREVTRHRIASYTQESTRYCNYSKDKFGNQLTFLIPSWSDIKPGTYTERRPNSLQLSDKIWFDAMLDAEKAYKDLLEDGCTPQMARGVLPLSLASKLYVTMNFREWRHFLRLRYFEKTGPVQPEMKKLSSKIWTALKYEYCVFFEDLEDE